MTIYITTEGDMLDRIAQEAYGDASLVSIILDANPGLSDQPMVLPYGVRIVLPDAPKKPAKSALKEIWG